LTSRKVIGKCRGLLVSLGLSLTIGCTFTGREPDLPPPLQTAETAPSLLPVVASRTDPASGFVQVGATSAKLDREDLPFEEAKELSEDELVSQVLRRNPTIQQMAAAAQAAAARFPQVTSLEDPRFGASFGPASIGSRNVDFAYRLEISQAIPFPGKLSLRGQSAVHDALAVGAEVDDARITLVEAARNAFADYYLAGRSVEVNEESVKLLQEFRDNASARYRTGQGEQQDVYQAEVAIARQRERASTLERMRRVSQARINTLLNLPADRTLPPPPAKLEQVSVLPQVSELRELAIDQRPDIAAVRARIASDEATLALAQREYYPDFEAMAAYDAFWQRPEQDLRPMIGVRLNVPIRTGRRDAAVVEAQARLTQRRAELARLTAQVGFQVQEAFEQVKETERSLKLYEESALPAARENVRLARSAYANAKVPFLNLIEAQRNLVELRERQYELLTEARRRRAMLDRATGTMPTPSESELPKNALPAPKPS
jgi:outer membrane protein TolC